MAMNEDEAEEAKREQKSVGPFRDCGKIVHVGLTQENWNAVFLF